ncbi:carbamoyltransferase HypF [Actinacidiphila acidipaludis]|uniref:Carbamoyltransferase n=1 Tax=Actinacidiphila acidipaludis TaxID=2873382 RepID=A0ABS7QA10_9ACTN|nr:carbamoyltransferase HypF [Streptomyces acidipaludis]MBY8880012.1 carbamoyltransferase HypF [Streptomyces acidipaludis]
MTADSAAAQPSPPAPATEPAAGVATVAAAPPASPEPRAARTERVRVTVRGVVQGVGFRPFVYALARELGLAGQVTNTGEGVVAEVEGTPEATAAFCERTGAEAPPLAVVQSVTREAVPPLGESGFRIVPSRQGGPRRTLVPPDTATCEACLAELRDPADRRYRHPFITCTHCGPRFTIVTALPYDRAHTTMAAFPLCPRCEREYTDPADRRFHAQPVACHDCGPRLRLVLPGSRSGGAAPVEDRGGDPVARARRLLAEGAVLAVKGLGGYHLACDASDENAVRTLRRRKARGDKPFAVMAADLADVEPLVRLGAAERNLLSGIRRPIVLLRRRPGTAGAGVLAASVAPGSADLGVMLPYTPLHHLLLGLPGDPPAPRLLVMTSGNLGGEPIVTRDDEALERLAPLVDAWLTHDRPIHVPCDDSVVRVIDGEELPVRRSRGYTPFPVPLPVPVVPALAAGGDLKNVFCLGEGRQAWLSAHVGDMDDLATLGAFDHAERQLEEITGVTPQVVAADRHPGYRSGRAAERRHGPGVRRVQHHHAHIAAAMADNGLDGGSPVIGVAFDGTGAGDDGAVWGGEILVADYEGYRRAAHLQYVPLPGGDAAVRHPYRMALAHLFAAGLPWDPELPCARACPEAERPILRRQLERGLHCVPTSSMGRLFDAVSSLAGVCHHAGYEAQAAVELEAAAASFAGAPQRPGYAFALAPGEASGPAGDGRTSPPATPAPLLIDPAPVLGAVVADLAAGTDRGRIAVAFHAAVADAVRRVCAAVRERTGIAQVALSGGVFANALLSSACAGGLREDGFTVLRHRLVPPNDGGLALGQLVVAARAPVPTVQPEA